MFCGQLFGGKKRAGSAKQHLKRVLVSVVAISMAGCTADKSKDTSSCELETIRFYPIGFGDDFMIGCMKRKGYEFDVSPSECGGGTRMVMQPNCYTPSGAIAKFFDDLRRSNKTKSK
jgi:hypothetical protein